MTENYEQELKLIGVVEESLGMEWIAALELFSNHFNPAHMRQRIEREMAKDDRIKELEEIAKAVADGNFNQAAVIKKAKELLK